MPQDEVITQEPEQAAQGMETRILQAVYKKGPALPVELAVRTYSFPEEISDPLVNLEQKGLVERQPLKAGEMIVLTKAGHEQIRSR